MKEATGELSMTVVTIIAIALIVSILTFLKGPIENYINDTFSKVGNNGINDVSD